MSGTTVANDSSERVGADLRDVTSLEYILLGDLRDLLEETPSEQTSRWLVAILDALIDAMPKEMALKSEEEGYLSFVLDEFPNWDSEVDKLYEEKMELYRQLQQLRHHIVCRHPYRSIADRVRMDLNLWMTGWIAHQRHERRLIQTAMNLEVGCGD